MSFKRKHVSAPSHPYILFREYNDDPDFLEVSLKKVEDDDLRHELYVFINENLDYERRGNYRYHLLAKTDLNHFVTEIDKIVNGEEEEEDPNKESSEEEETDDELIQEALQRRLKSESSHSAIEEDHVSDSDMEDVISLARRSRYVLKRLSELERRLLSLEKKL